MRPSSATALVALTLLLVMTFAPAADAHPARAPCAWEQRLLHDHTDDLGGSAVEAKHGHELHALDIVESWDEQLGDVLVFRLAYEGGYGSGALGSDPPDKLRDVLTFRSGGKSFTFEWSSTDNAAFTGTFDRVVQPAPLTTACNSTQTDEGHLGERSVIEGWVALDKHGLAQGAKLSDFKVEAYADTTRADTMGEGTTAGDDDSWFKLAEYEIGARPRIVDASLDWSRVDMQVGQNKTIVVKVTNLLDRAQELRVTYRGPDGTSGTFHLDDDLGYRQDDIAWSMPAGKGSEATLHLYLVPSEPVQDATVTVDVYGDMGAYTGHITRTLTLKVTEATAVTTVTTEATSESDPTRSKDTASDKEAPPVPVMVAVGALFFLAGRARRQG